MFTQFTAFNELLSSLQIPHAKLSEKKKKNIYFGAINASAIMLSSLWNGTELNYLKNSLIKSTNLLITLKQLFKGFGMDSEMDHLNLAWPRAETWVRIRTIKS